jgi:hypothetical protein
MYCVKVLNRFEGLEYLGAEVEIKSDWERNRKDTKMSAKESLWHGISRGSTKNAQNYYINGDMPLEMSRKIRWD